MNKFLQLRTDRNLSQKEVADACHITTASLERYEHGGRPRNEALTRLADFYGVPVNYLRTREHVEKPTEDDAIDQIKTSEADRIISEYEAEGAGFDSLLKALNKAFGLGFNNGIRYSRVTNV